MDSIYIGKTYFQYVYKHGQYLHRKNLFQEAPRAIKHLWEKLKLKENVGTVLQQNQRTLVVITHLNDYGRFKIHFCICLPSFFLQIRGTFSFYTLGAS